MILKGRYCILEQLNKGGMGKLYLARDMELGSLWAVKEIPCENKKEAKLLCSLGHPAIPKMIDYVEKEKVCYLIMEYIKGESLEEKLKKGKGYSFREIVNIGICLAEALEYLHTRKPPVCFGDLKPANVMISEVGKVYLVDLGSAALNYEGRVQECSGTRGYAAPEQYLGRISTQSDIYALGKTLWVLCGKKKWWYAMEYPVFGYTVWKCGRKKQADRYASVGLVKKALENSIKNKKLVRFAYMGPLTVCCVLGSLIFVDIRQENRLPLEESLSKITDMYYREDFINGTKEQRKEICKTAEKNLQDMLGEYTEIESQRKLLLLLAVNAQLQGREDSALFYYEQLKIFHSGYEELYGEYGNYLLQIGKDKKSTELWEEFLREERKGNITGAETKNGQLWSEYMTQRRMEEDGKTKKE